MICLIMNAINHEIAIDSQKKLPKPHDNECFDKNKMIVMAKNVASLQGIF